MSKKAEKTSVEKLTEELLINRKNGFMDVTDEQVKKADKFCEGYKTFLNKAKTEREAVFETIAYAEKNGFVPFDREASYKAGDKVYYNNRDKSLILAVIGTKPTIWYCLNLTTTAVLKSTNGPPFRWPCTDVLYVATERL